MPDHGFAVSPIHSPPDIRSYRPSFSLSRSRHMPPECRKTRGPPLPERPVRFLDRVELSECKLRLGARSFVRQAHIHYPPVCTCLGDVRAHLRGHLASRTWNKLLYSRITYFHAKNKSRVQHWELAKIIIFVLRFYYTCTPDQTPALPLPFEISIFYGI